jgi:hypothetical protein
MRFQNSASGTVRVFHQENAIRVGDSTKSKKGWHCGHEIEKRNKELGAKHS